MQLTYRGVSYQTNPPTEKAPKIGCVRKYRLSEDCDSNKIAWIRPITYYVYRGVSYTKCPLVKAKTRLLQ